MRLSDMTIPRKRSIWRAVSSSMPVRRSITGPFRSGRGRTAWKSVYARPIPGTPSRWVTRPALAMMVASDIPSSTRRGSPPRKLLAIGVPWCGAESVTTRPRCLRSAARSARSSPSKR